VTCDCAGTMAGVLGLPGAAEVAVATGVTKVAGRAGVVGPIGARPDPIAMSVKETPPNSNFRGMTESVQT
jgi:hypothetical protein